MDELLRQWREQSDLNAFGELLRLHRDRAYATAFRILGNAADAEDVVQEASLKLLSRTHGFEDMGAFRISLYRAVIQCAFNAVRGRSRYRTQKATYAKEAIVISFAGRTQEVDRATACERAEVAAQLRKAMGCLSIEQRAAVVLANQQGLKRVVAAEVLGLPRQTFSDRLDKAMVRLRAECCRLGLAPAIISGLLIEEASLVAPETFCRTLDELVASHGCDAVPLGPDASKVLRPSDSFSQTGFGDGSKWGAKSLKWMFSMGCVGVLVASVYTFGAFEWRQSESPRVVAYDANDANGISKLNNGREEMKKPVLAGMMLSAVLLGGASANAGEAATVEDVLKEIRTHKVEKKKKADEQAAARQAARDKAHSRYRGQGKEGRHRGKHSKRRNRKSDTRKTEE